MKIALIHYRMILRGGLETRLFSYIEYLTGQGHEVTVIVSRIAKDIQIPKNIRLVQLSHLKFPKFLKQYFFDNRLRRFMEKSDFDFSLSLGRTSAQDAVLAPGNHPGYLAAIGKTKLSWSDKVQTFLDRRGYENSKIIFAASEMMKREVIEHFGVDPARIQVLFPPADVRRFHLGLKAQKHEFRAKYGFSEEKKSFLFVSTGHKRKGLPLLLQLFEQLDADKFELIIAGNPPVKSSLHNVAFVGFIKETEELYAAADYTIHPSIYEPYGQIVAESILCGTPVLVSHMVGAMEIVENTNGRIIHSFQVKDWLSAIMEAETAEFTFSESFAKEKGLLLEQHLEQILTSHRR